MNPQLKHIPGADGLRAIACLLVVWHHTTQRFNPESSAVWVQWVHFLGMRGEVGVSVFFVLSGCLLSLPFWSAFAKQEPFPKLRTYATNRAARVIPAYWLNLVFCTLIAFWIFDQKINWWRLISGVLFINSYHYSTFFPAELNGPLWSIGLEVSCYILLPLFLFLIIKNSRKISTAFISLIGCIIFLQLINPWIINNFMTSNISKGWDFGLIGGAKLWLPYWNIATFFTQFLCGSLGALAIIYLRGQRVKSSSRFDFLSGLTAIAAALLILTQLNPGTPDGFTKQPYMAPFFAILISLFIISVSQSKYAYRLLDNRLFKWIANLSFSIYLWHMFIMVMIERKILENYTYYGVTNLIQWVITSLIVLLSSMIIAAISWRFLESPILKSARRMVNPSN